jgi:iron complex outermembrane receptor protein
MLDHSLPGRHAIALAIATLLTTSAAKAAEPTPPEFDLAATMVIAPAPSSPLTIVTDPKSPRQPLPASDGADYLKTIPGFTAIRSGGTNGDLVLRGMFGSRLNILTNGTTMLGACPGRMDAPTSYIAPESYDKLTVINGPQSVIYGPMGSAGTILFERNTKRFAEPGARFDGSVVAGSFGRNDQNADFTAGNPDAYARIIANHAHAQDYKDGNGNTIPSQWDKWNVDTALGLTPDDHTRLELTAGTGDGYARYAGRGMDGVHFRRESLGLRFDKSHIGEVLQRIEAQVYYNDADHVMDNFTLRAPDPMSSMPTAMASDVGRRTLGGRVAATLRWADALQLVTGVDMQSSRLRSRSGTDLVSYSTLPWVPSASFFNTGAFGELTWFATEQRRLIAGARIDQTTARDDRTVISSMMGARPNPTAGDDRTRTLPSGFVRYEHDVSGLPATVYAGLGHAERFPDYWELISPRMGPAGSVNAFSAIQPEKTTQLDVGAQYKSARLDAWVSAYAGVVNDFILFNYRPGMMGAMSQVSNVDARIAGGELGGTWRLGGPHRWRPRLCVGAQCQHRPAPAADAAARSAPGRGVRARALVGRRAVARGSGPAPLCIEPGQRGGPGLRAERGLWRPVAARRLRLRQDGARDGRGRQPAEQDLHRAPEPGRQCGLWLSCAHADHGARPHGVGTHEPQDVARGERRNVACTSRDGNRQK